MSTFETYLRSTTDVLNTSKYITIDVVKVLLSEGAWFPQDRGENCGHKWPKMKISKLKSSMQAPYQAKQTKIIDYIVGDDMQSKNAHVAVFRFIEQKQ